MRERGVAESAALVTMEVVVTVAALRAAQVAAMRVAEMEVEGRAPLAGP